MTSLEKRDAQALRRLLHAAVALDADETAKPPPPNTRGEWPMPEVLPIGLKKNKKAAAFFETLRPTYQREYKVWISSAKQSETIAKRLAETLQALSRGKKWAQRRE